VAVGAPAVYDKDGHKLRAGSNPLITVAKAFQFGRAIWDERHTGLRTP